MTKDEYLEEIRAAINAPISDRDLSREDLKDVLEEGVELAQSQLNAMYEEDEILDDEEVEGEEIFGELEDTDE